MITFYEIKDYLQNLKYQNNELIWAKTWDDTKKGIEWISDLPGISPGRWAVGYNYLYVMTRILNEKEPKNVLDLGLGISSTLISQYFKGRNIVDGNHDVIEQSEEWAKFYSIKNRISSATTIHAVECIEKEYKGYRYYAYKDISQIISGKKYDVISIDGPTGSDKYSRRDIIEFLPDILSQSFVIIIDDASRTGEKRTITDIKNILRKNNIEFCEGSYQSMSKCTVITSIDNKFLCSM